MGENMVDTPATPQAVDRRRKTLIAKGYGMTETFKALVIDNADGNYTAGIKDLTVADLPDESVLVDVAYSTLNYKDGPCHNRER